MKIALVFSGIPRLLEKSKFYFQEKLLNNYDVDVFSIVWKTEEYKLLDQLYDNKILQFHFPTNFYLNYQYTRINVYSHWYSLQNACRTFFNYIETNGIKYDVVIRTRLDIALYNHVDLTNLDLELLHVANCHWPNSILFDDNLMITNQENYKKVFYNIFDWYKERLSNHTYNDIPEQKLYDYLTFIDMKYKITRNNNLDFILTRGLP